MLRDIINFWLASPARILLFDLTFGICLFGVTLVVITRHRWLTLYYQRRLRVLDEDCRKSGWHPARSVGAHYTRQYLEAKIARLADHE